jgi:hypothetical protein
MMMFPIYLLYSCTYSAIEEAGFKYAVPELTREALVEAVAQHIASGYFPVSPSFCIYARDSDGSHCLRPS